MAFTSTPSYTWVDGEVLTATKLNTAGAPTVADGQGYLFSNTGLTITDTGGTQSLAIVPGSAMTAARTLTITTGDADRTLTLSGSPTIGGNGSLTINGSPTIDDWFNQSVKTGDNVTFNVIGFGDATTTRTNLGLGSAALNNTADFDIAGAADALNVSARTVAGGTKVIFEINGSAVGLYIDSTFLGFITVH